MSDLLSYLKNWRYLDGAIPGDIPAETELFENRLGLGKGSY
jgi:hypothetical protein